MISAIWQYLGRQLSYSVLKVIKTTKNMHFVADFAYVWQPCLSLT
jgi:hypothetical protein